MFWFFCCCFVFVFYHKAWRILAAWLGIEPTAPALESEVSTTGQPGKSHGTWYFKSVSLSSLLLLNILHVPSMPVFSFPYYLKPY